MNMLKKIVFLMVCLAASLSGFAQVDTTAFMRQLLDIKGVSDVKPLNTDKFKEKYVLMIEQNLDGDDSSHGTFQQRVIVGLKGLDRATVMETEGYYADYALNPSYEEELSTLFKANLVVCEYRYFGKSLPPTKDGADMMTQGKDYWQYMTVDNSLRDLHHVREALGEVFKNKWISTGISKGGQTTMFYRATYPDDMDVSVSYVAPLNRAVEDGRHEKFLAKKVGTKEERKAVAAAQKELMDRKERLLPMLENMADAKDYHYNVDLSEIYDYCVMEYPFALWQWGTPTSHIPGHDESDYEWFFHFSNISEPDYFTCPSKFTPFHVQALRELGYYGYSNKGLKKQMKAKKTKGYLSRLMVPEQLQDIQFDDRLYKRTVKYLKENDPKHIFIYGEIDPWSASGVADWLDCSNKENMRVYVRPRGSHQTRIKHMPADMKADIMSRLTKWLSE